MHRTPILTTGAIVFLTGCSALSLHGDATDAQSHSAVESTPSSDRLKRSVGLLTGVVRIGDHAFRVEIAATARDRARGLMDRESLAPDSGMLFVYETPQTVSFWMRNTPIPLDVGFIRPDLTISSIMTMKPFSTDTYLSTEPVQFALELAAGEFARRGIRVGDTVVINGIE